MRAFVLARYRASHILAVDPVFQLFEVIEREVGSCVIGGGIQHQEAVDLFEARGFGLDALNNPIDCRAGRGSACGLEAFNDFLRHRRERYRGSAGRSS